MSLLRVEVVGIKGLNRYLDTAPKNTRKAAKLAINDTTRVTRTEASRLIRSQVNLSASYLNRPDRLFISNFASENNLSSTISARTRGTSLLTYGAKQQYTKGKTVSRKRGGVRVKVKSGGRFKVIRQAFIVSLKYGTADTGNVGVAVRSTEGLNLKRHGVSAGKAYSGFRVLYGPSVDQVFRDVRNELTPFISKRVGERFIHHFRRLSK